MNGCFREAVFCGLVIQGTAFAQLVVGPPANALAPNQVVQQPPCVAVPAEQVRRAVSCVSGKEADAPRCRTLRNAVDAALKWPPHVPHGTCLERTAFHRPFSAGHSSPLLPVSSALNMEPPYRPSGAPSAAYEGFWTGWKAHGRVTYENLCLPGGERMGLAGGGWLFDAGPVGRLGLAGYGAVRGEHGGFITLGAMGEWQAAFTPQCFGQIGLFIGAGGGNGGRNAQAGGGLMFRADAGVSYALGPGSRLGAGLSHVRFPSGTISSTQPYVMLQRTFSCPMTPGWHRGAFQGSGTDPGKFQCFAQEFALVVRSGRAPEGGRLVLTGVEWLGFLDQHWFLKLEAEGAAGGGHAGYMQALIGGGYRQALFSGTALKGHVALGPAGGGAVDTGGGLLWDAGISMQIALTRRLALELTAGHSEAPSGAFRGNNVTMKCSYRFELPALEEQTPLAGLQAHPLRVRATSQTYLKAAEHWRKGFVNTPVSNLGLQWDVFLSPRWFLTGQGLAAYEGRAGAYMIGLMGLGWHWDFNDAWFAEGEWLLGAAGGGGLATGGGAVGQVNVSVGWRLTRTLALMLTAGELAAFKGPLRAHVAGLGLAYQFTGWTRP